MSDKALRWLWHPVGMRLGVRRWVLRGGALALLVLPAAGCAGRAEPGLAPQVSATVGSADASAVTASPTPAEAHTVEPPGPLTGALEYADMLVFNQRNLSEETVRRISRLPGIEAVEPMGLAQVTIENRAINVAAVDPATYRRFTPQGSAQTLAVWERVAGGEIAIDPALRDERGKRLGGDADLLTMGPSVDSPTIHIGALAEQVPQVDAVVNQAWGRELGMQLDNALLISFGRTSPQSVRPAIERIVGDQASVQVLGPDLDTSVVQTAFLTGGTVSSVVGSFNYRVLGGGRIAPDPAWVAAHIETQQLPILGSVTCNKAIFPQLRAALEEVIATGLADEIHPDEYAGCYYPRFIATTTTLSNHSFGTALDLNVPGNQRGTVGQIDRGVVAIFKRWGFAWGGDWSWTDPMHFEMNAVVDPR